jgi:uncharacterized protein
MLHVFLVIAAIGHAVLWVGFVNRLHGTAVPRRPKDLLTAICGLGVTLIPLVLAYVAYTAERAGSLHQLLSFPNSTVEWVVWGYLAICASVCAAALSSQLWFRYHLQRQAALLDNHTRELEIRGSVAELAAPGLPALCARLPGNEIFRPQLHEKQLAIPNLPAVYAGLRVAHLTDLHISGRIGKRYFEQIVDHVNDARPDIIAITGDIVERNTCIDWIPGTLGRLRAPRGVYYILGNHDLRVDVARLKATLTEFGLDHLGGQTRSLAHHDTNEPPILLAGNELPWQGPAPSVSDTMNATERRNELRILLAHTPDQFDWAAAHDFDLVLAGHNHGGQVCIPLIGPVLVPSRYGTRFACGVFTRGNTVLHVSRGTSSLSPVRYNCPPEVAILVLQQKPKCKVVGSSPTDFAPHD